jgi:2-oxoacid:acceptor oxidoreductase gamma subunit (pyruvate/2-ketoisovalerate family)
VIEIRFHGRGGQGSVVASEVLAAALFSEGNHVQAFPTFGVERRGAPVAAFLRIDRAPIRLRCQVATPDHVIILDPTLIPVIDVTAGLKEGGSILINSEKPPADFAGFAESGWRVATVDAARIAHENGLGSRTNPIVNTAILGAFARVTGLVSLDAVVTSIQEGIPQKTASNMAAAREAHQATLTSALEEVQQ